MSQIFEKSLEELGVILSDRQKEQFEMYYKTLIEWNQVMNLTTIIKREEVYTKHFLDSLTLCRIVDLTKSATLIDIGTGAGFPGIPLKIVFPEIEVVLLDSLNKRIKFLNDVIDKLELQGIKAVHGRAEELAKRPEYRESFDIGTSRAVSRMCVLSEYCMPYIRAEGIFISYKAGAIEEELEEGKNAIKILGGEIEKIDKFTLAGTDIERSLIKIRKKQNTPRKYPRKAGMPSKEPL